MLASQITELLMFVGAVEGREAATKQQVAAWLTLLEPVEFADAMQAAKEHYLNESRRLWPADILNWRDGQVQTEIVNFAQRGLVVSERLWSNASILPAEEVERLGLAHARGEGEAYERRLQIVFGLTPRPKAVGA